jgi:hypothetical protein
LKYNRLTNPVLTGKLFGATVELTATGVECVGCTAENKESGGVMEVTGTGAQVTFSGVSVIGLPKCTVVGPETGKVLTEKLKFTTTAVGGATLEPVSGTTLAEFDITGAGCTVAGNNIEVAGKVAVTMNGAKAIVNVTKASNLLEMEFELASLKATGTLEAGTGGTLRPVALTTA